MAHAFCSITLFYVKRTRCPVNLRIVSSTVDYKYAYNLYRQEIDKSVLFCVNCSFLTLPFIKQVFDTFTHMYLHKYSLQIQIVQRSSQIKTGLRVWNSEDFHTLDILSAHQELSGCVRRAGIETVMFSLSPLDAELLIGIISIRIRHCTGFKILIT